MTSTLLDKARVIRANVYPCGLNKKSNNHNRIAEIFPRLVFDLNLDLENTGFF